MLIFSYLWLGFLANGSLKRKNTALMRWKSKKRRRLQKIKVIYTELLSQSPWVVKSSLIKFSLITLDRVWTRSLKCLVRCLWKKLTISKLIEKQSDQIIIEKLSKNWLKSSLTKWLSGKKCSLPSSSLWPIGVSL